MTTKSYGVEISWSLGTCSSVENYYSNTEYIEECCLNTDEFTLKCKDSFGDGWQGGFIEIQGTKYCEDFTAGTEKSIQIDINASSKYCFSQISFIAIL